MHKLLIRKCKSKDQFEIQVNLETEKVKDIKRKIQQKKKIDTLQIMLLLQNQKVLDDNERPLSTLQLQREKIIFYKNLGSQILWNQVFYLEYLGPIIAFSSMYFLGDRQNYTTTQKLDSFIRICFSMGIIHYLKRQLQTIFVHVFSRDSMPFKRALINFFHYWILFGAAIGTELFFFHKDPQYSDSTIAVIYGIWAFCQLMNLQCHRVLSSFRKGDKKKGQQNYQSSKKRRGIPRVRYFNEGYGFDFVSCANYFWEMCGWFAFSGMSRCYTSYFFTILSSIQMLIWALKKHSNYKKQFKQKYPSNRKSMIPMII